jgi:hypothetical protein
MSARSWNLKGAFLCHTFQDPFKGIDESSAVFAVKSGKTAMLRGSTIKLMKLTVFSFSRSVFTDIYFAASSTNNG